MLRILFIIFVGAQFISGILCSDSPWVSNFVTRVPNFPIENINFLCYPNLLENPAAFKKLIKEMADHYRNEDITSIVGLEARGFVFGVALAYELEKPFIMMRKKGKLPRKTSSIAYGLEYGKDVFQIEEESIHENDRILIVDDLLATGGTANAAIELIEGLGGQVIEVACVFELENLKGRDRVKRSVYAALPIPE